LIFDHFLEIQQDTLIRPQQQVNPSFQGITVRKPLLDLERAEAVIRQFEQREQEIVVSQQVKLKQKSKSEENVGKPSIEVDAQLAKYMYIGCSPRANFPDTINLTILERYYQPIKSKTATTTVSPEVAYPDTTRILPVSLPDSVQTAIQKTAIQKTIIEKPAENKWLTCTVRPAGYPSAVTAFIIFALIYIAIIKHKFGRNMLDVFRSVFSLSQSMRLYEESRETDRHAAVFSNIWFTIITGIYITIVFPFFGISPFLESHTLSILFFSFATGLLYFLKARIWQTLGIVFHVEKLSGLYIHNMFLYNRNAGLIVFPLVAFIPYMTEIITPYLVFGVIVVFLIFYLLRLYRFFIIFHAQIVSVFYFILYLCTLEILPLLILIKSCKMLI